MTLATTLPVIAQSPPVASRPAIDRTALERVATGKARSALLEKIQALPLKGEMTVGAWASSDVARDRSLRKWARSLARFGLCRIFSDGGADADVRATPDEIARQLTTLLELGKPAAPPLTAADIQSAAKTWKTQLAGGAAEASVVSDDRKADGWEDVAPEGIQLARLAATGDAVLALVDEASRLKVTAARRLTEFLDSSAEIRTSVTDAIRDAAKVRVELGSDQIAVAEAKIAMSDLIRILTDTHQNLYKGNEFQAPDFREMALNVGLGEVAGQGLAPPPSTYLIKPQYETIELDTPVWAKQTLTVVGRHEPTDRDAAAAGDSRIAIARFDGVDRLRRQIEALKVQGDVTVEQFLARRPELKDDVILFLSGARVTQSTATPTADSAVEATLELPLWRLWTIVRRGMTMIEVDPSTTQPTSRPASASQPSAGNG
ncbi:MAG: hypothetical protein ACKVS9_18130 [Phycisphaerae bacterium]